MSARTLEGRAMTEAEHAEYLRVISDTVLRDRAVGISDRFMKAAFTAVGGASTSVSSYPLGAVENQAQRLGGL